VPPVAIAKLEEIAAMPADAVELLEAVGYQDAGDFGNADTVELLAELSEANQVLGIMAGLPAKQRLEQWQKLALGQGEDPEERPPAPDAEPEPAPARGADAATWEAQIISEDEINLEQDSGMLEMLAMSPEARPLEPAAMEQRELVCEDLPEGLLLSGCKAGVEINVMTSLRRANAHLRRRDEVKRIGLKASRIRNFNDLRKEAPGLKPAAGAVPREEVARIESLNAGTDPGSRKFIKGVPHARPASIRLAALSTLVMYLLLASNLLGLPALVLGKVHLGMDHLMLWALGLLAALLFSLLCYLLFALRARCMVCSQRPLVPKQCVKHKKAHHVRGLGYILPTALQLLLYKWFYCTYCGTAIRLKK
jgi:hypothetical protein